MSDSVKKKTLLFNSLEVSYDYEVQKLTVVNSGGEEMTFDAEELAELKAALRLLGLETPASEVETR